MSRDDTITFATQLLELVHGARTTTSYKYALLVALIELAVENHGGLGEGTITTRQIATRVLELYWPQARPYREQDARCLRQLPGNKRSIVDHVAAFRAAVGDAGTPQLARLRDRAGYEALVDEVEWLMIRNPIPLLQRLGKRSLDLLYEPPWSVEPPKGPVRAYQRALAGGEDPDGEFDNRIQFLPGVGARLARLAPLFLPLIRSEWTRFVARRNRPDSDEAQLEEFLFAPERRLLARGLRADLARLQDRRCFYCKRTLSGAAELDHFLAWSRCGASAIDNLVVAHAGCNGDKSDLLVAASHLDRWIARLDRRRDDLREIAERRRWYAEPRRIAALVRASYTQLGDGTPLWVAVERWEPAAAKTLEPSRRALTKVLRGL
jgi:hypothetical protein